MNSTDGAEKKVKIRNHTTNTAVIQLYRVWKATKIIIHKKTEFLEVISSFLLYGRETQKVIYRITRHLQTFVNRGLRKKFKIC